MRRMAACAGWRPVDTGEWKDLDEFLFARAMEHDSPKLLFRLACEYLISSRWAGPGWCTCWSMWPRPVPCPGEDLDAVAHLLTPRHRDELDLLLMPDVYLGRTPLAWLGIEPPSRSLGRSL